MVDFAEMNTATSRKHPQTFAANYRAATLFGKQKAGMTRIRKGTIQQLHSELGHRWSTLAHPSSHWASKGPAGQVRFEHTFGGNIRSAKSEARRAKNTRDPRLVGGRGATEPTPANFFFFFNIQLVKTD